GHCGSLRPIPQVTVEIPHPRRFQTSSEMSAAYAPRALPETGELCRGAFSFISGQPDGSTHITFCCLVRIRKKRSSFHLRQPPQRKDRRGWRGANHLARPFV